MAAAAHLPLCAGERCAIDPPPDASADLITQASRSTLQLEEFDDAGGERAPIKLEP
jgi:hypothetical protein